MSHNNYFLVFILGERGKLSGWNPENKSPRQGNEEDCEVLHATSHNISNGNQWPEYITRRL